MSIGRMYTPLPPISSRADDDPSGDDDEVSDSEIANMDEEDANKIAKSTLWKLSNAQTLNSESYSYAYTLQAVLYRNDTKEEYARFGAYMTSLNFVKILQKLMKNHFVESFTGKEKELLWPSLYTYLRIMWSLSDKSVDFCNEMYNIKFHVDLLGCLKSPLISPSKMDQDIPFTTVQPIIGSLHNLVQKVPASWEDMRNNDAVEILQPYRECSNQMVASVALMVQAYIINEKDNEKINSGLESFQYLISILDCTIRNESFHSMRFAVMEVIEVLNKLAVNDSNKKRIIEAGGLPYYVVLMKGGEYWENDVVAEAARGLWILGFKCKDEITKEIGCIETLKSLTSHKDPIVREKANGALWILEKQDSLAKKLKDAVNKNSATPGAASEGPGQASAKDSGHIFISYQWDSKSTVLKVRDRLKSAGFKTWLDEDDMSGSVLEAMAVAVEKAHTVIICLSQKYKDSPNCRTEAEYTFRLRKKVIPLRLQVGYYPDGWLGILVGSKLVFDVSQPTRYEDSVKHLIKELSQSPEGEPVDNAPKTQTVTKTETEVVTKSNESRNNGNANTNNDDDDSVQSNMLAYLKWKNEDVKKWITDIKVLKAKKILNDFEGQQLVELAKMRKDAPETFFNYCLKQEIPMKEILDISSALRGILKS